MLENENKSQDREEDTLEPTKKSRKKKVAIVLVCAIAALAVAYLILCQIVQNDVIWKNVSINGVSLKGLTCDEAAEAISQKMEEDYADTLLTIALDGLEYEIELLSLLEIDASAEIAEAYVFGHGEWYTIGLDWLYMRLFKQSEEEIELDPTVKTDIDIDELIEGTGILEYRSLVETTYEETDSGIIVHKGETGVVADGEALAELVQEALDSFDFSQTIECPYTVEEPSVPDFQEIADSIYVEPVSAALDAENNYAIVESTDGRMLDVEAAESAYEEAEEGEDIEIAFTVLTPDITTEDMEENLFADLLGTYQTTVSGASGKFTNVGIVTGLVDGTILLSGETFSYLGIIGEPTAERGFEESTVFINGEMETEVGGGICQVSSTIFAALLQTDLEVVWRQNHSLEVSYIPYGMDATVYYPSLDFQFRNNHTYPIKLTLSFVNNVLTVQIWGTQESDLTVECVVKEIGTLDYETYRYYYDTDGNLVSTEYIGRSKYNKSS